MISVYVVLSSYKKDAVDNNMVMETLKSGPNLHIFMLRTPLHRVIKSINCIIYMPIIN